MLYGDTGKRSRSAQIVATSWRRQGEYRYALRFIAALKMPGGADLANTAAGLHRFGWLGSEDATLLMLATRRISSPLETQELGLYRSSVLDFQLVTVPASLIPASSSMFDDKDSSVQYRQVVPALKGNKALPL